MFTIPQLQSVTNGTNGFDISCDEDAADVKARELRASGQAYVVSGCAVTFVSSRKFNIAAGVVVVAGKRITVSSQTVTATAVTTHDRRDMVVVSSAGTASIVKGTQNGKATWIRSTPVATGLAPVKGTLATTKVLLAEIAVPHGTGGSTLHSYNLVDKRCMSIAGQVTSGAFTTSGTLSATATHTVGATGTLAPGTYTLDVICTVLFGTGTSATGCIVYAAQTSGTMTFSGPTGTQVAKSLASSWASYSFTTEVVVTVTGKVKIVAFPLVTCHVEKQDSKTKATVSGYTCTRSA